MIVTLSSEGHIVIPKSIYEAMSLWPGMTFQIRQRDRDIVLEPVETDFTSLINALYGKYAQADILSSLEAEHKEEIVAETLLP